VPGNCHDSFLVVLLALDPLIQPHYVLTSQMPLMDDHQVPGFDKGPLQVLIHIPADLPQPGVPTARVHPRYQARIAGQMRGRGKPGPSRRYFSTVRGDTRIPSFSFNS
jgi:hypothetical protein